MVPVMPVFAAAAGGGVVLDVDGNSLIDFGSGIAVTSVGNADPRVVQAATDAMSAFTHTCFMITPYEGYIAVAERLAASFPTSAGDPAQGIRAFLVNSGSEGDENAAKLDPATSAPGIRAFLVNSGSEGVENAVKIARFATGRAAIIALDGGFHGRTNLALAMTGRARPYREGFGPFAPEVYRVPSSEPFRDGLTGHDAARRTIEHIEDHIGSQQVAAIVAEPIQGEGGFVVPAPGFWSELAAWCRDSGALLIADEVQSGMGRTGQMWAVEHEEVVPDLIVAGKALAGGMPLAAVFGRADVMDAPPPGALGGTYGGHPAAAAACLAVFDLLEEHSLLDRARHIGDVLTTRLSEIAATDPRIGDIRGRGAMIAAEIVNPGTHDPDPATAAAVADQARARGVIVLTCGTRRNVIRLLPPLVIGDDLLSEGLDVLAEAFAATT